MYLKSIEVQGFKSFANKIVFDFHNGITGIVGPNGSGKSNVGDAVRWVLGEQSAKQLRGASMQDIIFAGTENRKPLSYAYVAITLDNADHKLPVDYEEVTVARRVYRSGESEYLLNGNTCRLKDVTELFYDTGIGKEGYSIIGQGQIEKILNGKPEERRELFDEAAGIVKYKKRKATAQKKLENERENLVRVNDILSELERQVGPLEKQAEKARVYLKKKEELKTYDVNMFLMEMTRIDGQLHEVGEKCGIAEAQLHESKDSYEQVKTEYERMESEIEQLEQAIGEVRENLSGSTVLKGKLEGQINVLKEQINTGYFEKLIQTYLLDNQHGALVTIVPEPGRTARLDAELKEKLQVYKESLSRGEIEKLIADTKHLQEYQEEPSSQEDLEKIPMLTRADISREIAPIYNEEMKIADIPMVFHEIETNGIGYLDLMFDLSDVPEKDLPMVGLLQAVLGIIDTEHYEYGELFNEINRHTGGIGTSLELYPDVTKVKEKEFKATFEIKGKALYGQIPFAIRMMKEILTASKLDDEKRLKEILSMTKTRLQDRFLSA